MLLETTIRQSDHETPPDAIQKKKKGWAEPEGLKAGRRARTCRLFPSLFWLSIINLFQKCRPEGMSSTCLFDDNMP